MIIDLFRRILDLGLHADDDPFLKARIRVINSIVPLTVVFITLLIAIELLGNELVGKGIQANRALYALLIVNLLIPPYLNYRRRFIASRLYYLITSYAIIAIDSLIQNKLIRIF